jgi:hypothetical protein
MKLVTITFPSSPIAKAADQMGDWIVTPSADASGTDYLYLLIVPGHDDQHRAGRQRGQLADVGHRSLTLALRRRPSPCFPEATTQGGPDEQHADAE